MSAHESFSIHRRRVLQILGATALAQTAVRSMWAADAVHVRIAANGGAGLILIELVKQQGFMRAAGAQEQMVMGGAPPDSLKALVDDRADVCVTSGFNGLLPAIEKGAPVKIVGAALQTPALAVYSSKPEIKTISDLIGRTVGVGPLKGLLHITMIALLELKGVDPAKVHFVSIGSNAEVFRAVEAGKVDAGPSDVSNMDSKASGVQVLADGKMWTELPDYPYQFAYASDRALRQNREGIVRALAGYGKMYRFISSPDSWTAYLKARRAAGGDEAGGRAGWNYIQTVHPYAGSPETSKKRIDYLQALDVSVGLQKSVLPLASVADLSLARDAVKLI